VSHFDLAGRVAVVTGGNGGIGLGMARGLARAGAAVAVAARKREKSLRAVDELEALGAPAAAFEVDVTDEAAVAALVQAVVERFGRLDILVNNAGINIRKPPQDLALAEWRQVLDTNLTSAFLVSRAVYPVMKAQGGGKIIKTASGFGMRGGRNNWTFVAAKAGLPTVWAISAVFSVVTVAMVVGQSLLGYAGVRLIAAPWMERYAHTLAGLVIALTGIFAIFWRFRFGLGATTNLSDGYPFGLWIAFDVVTGTALALSSRYSAIIR